MQSPSVWLYSKCSESSLLGPVISWDFRTSALPPSTGHRDGFPKQAPHPCCSQSCLMPHRGPHVGTVGCEGLCLELGGERINTPTTSCKAGLDWEELGDCQELERCAGRVGRALLGELGQEAQLGFRNLSLPASHHCLHPLSELWGRWEKRHSLAFNTTGRRGNSQCLPPSGS